VYDQPVRSSHPQKLQFVHSRARLSGLCGSIALPELRIRFENWRPGGVDAAIPVEIGMEPLFLSFRMANPRRCTSPPLNCSPSHAPAQYAQSTWPSGPLLSESRKTFQFGKHLSIKLVNWSL